jgi:hypothetical protein
MAIVTMSSNNVNPREGLFMIAVSVFAV